MVPLYYTKNSHIVYTVRDIIWFIFKIQDCFIENALFLQHDHGNNCVTNLTERGSGDPWPGDP